MEAISCSSSTQLSLCRIHFQMLQSHGCNTMFLLPKVTPHKLQLWQNRVLVSLIPRKYLRFGMTREPWTFYSDMKQDLVWVVKA